MLGYDCDAAEMPEASYTVDMAALIDGEDSAADSNDNEQLQALINKRAAHAMNFIFCTIMGHRNTRLAMIAYAIANGFTWSREKTIEQWAAELGVSKQALSKEVTWFRDVAGHGRALGGLKSNVARNHCRDAQLNRYRGVCGASYEDSKRS